MDEDLSVAHTILHIPRGEIHKASFLPKEATCAWLSHGYAAFGTLEKLSAHVQFQELRARLWLLGELVAPTLPYGVETCRPSLHKAYNWEDLEGSLVLITATR